MRGSHVPTAPGHPRGRRLAAVPVLAALAAAHDGRPPEPHDLWSAWSWEPLVLAGLAAGGSLYALGVRRVWRRAGSGRGVKPWEAASFAAGLAALFVALVSPLDALAAALVSAHMAQHVLLTVVAAPLLALGAPHVAFLWALPAPHRRSAAGWARWRGARATWDVLRHPLAAWTLHAVVLWSWHAPRLYEATLRSEVVHAVQHASFLGSALLFWWVLLHPARGGRSAYGVGVFVVFATAMHSGALGALLTFSSRPWYPAYAPRVEAWGLTPLEDQQLAGLVMWIPAGLVYVAAGLALRAVWLGALDLAADRARLRA